MSWDTYISTGNSFIYIERDDSSTYEGFRPFKFQGNLFWHWIQQSLQDFILDSSILVSVTPNWWLKVMGALFLLCWISVSRFRPCFRVAIVVAMFHPFDSEMTVSADKLYLRWSFLFVSDNLIRGDANLSKCACSLFLVLNAK